MDSSVGFFARRPAANTNRSPKRQRPRSPRRRRSASEPVAIANPYMLYYVDRFPLLKEQCDNVTSVASVVSREWAELTEAKKAVYMERARATKNAKRALSFFCDESTRGCATEPSAESTGNKPAAEVAIESTVAVETAVDESVEPVAEAVGEDGTEALGESETGAAAEATSEEATKDAVHPVE